MDAAQGKGDGKGQVDPRGAGVETVSDHEDVDSVKSLWHLVIASHICKMGTNVLSELTGTNLYQLFGEWCEQPRLSGG